MKYFVNVKNIEDLKKMYRELALKYHPDRPNGNAEIMKAVNNEYDELYPLLKNKHKAADQEGQQQQQETYTDTEIDDFREIIDQIISYPIDIEIIGSWVWVWGSEETKKIKDELKQLGFKWARKKKAWTWHQGPYKKHGKKEYDINDIRSKYGSHRPRPTLT